MPNTDSHGYVAPEDTDPFAPAADMRGMRPPMHGRTSIPVANLAAQNALRAVHGPAGAKPLTVYNASDDLHWYAVNGTDTDWRMLSPVVATRSVNATASGTLNPLVSDGKALFAADQTIPAHPLGRVPWELVIEAKCQAQIPTNSGVHLRVFVGGVEQGPATYFTNGGTEARFTLETRIPIDRTAADTADMTVRIELQAVVGTAQIIAGGKARFTAQRRMSL